MTISKMSNKREIEINGEDLKFIYGDGYELFKQKIIPNCNCGRCDSHYQSTIVNYKIFLNDLNDIILKGYCQKCNSPVNRYVETGEVEEYHDRIEKVRKRYTLN